MVRSLEEADLIVYIGRHPILPALTLVLAVCFTTPAFASPALPSTQGAQARTRVSASQAAVAAAVRDYASAQARLAAIEAELARQSARLDQAIERRERLQRRLGSRASGMYRRGRFEFVEVLVSSVTFDQFASLWDALVRINRRDAQAIAELRHTREKIAATSTELMRRQAAASVELRRLAQAQAKARRELAGDRAAYERYLEGVAQAKAASVARVAAGAGTTPGAVATATRQPATRPVGSGEWKTAVASCYGMGAVGMRTASGRVIRADSMLVAHKTLPFGTLVEFSYKGRRGVASVEDRGPHVPGRSFDLGPGIARILGIEGVETVRWRVVSR